MRQTAGMSYPPPGPSGPPQQPPAGSPPWPGAPTGQPGPSGSPIPPGVPATPGTPPPGYGYAPTPAGWQPPGGWPGLRPDGSTKGPALGPALGILGVGALVGLVALAFIVVEFIGLIDNERFDLPGSLTLDLEEGEWTVFGNVDGAFFTAGDIEVDGPADVDIDRPDFDESRSQGSQDYEAVAELQIEESGEYTISVDTFGADGEALVSRSFSTLGDAVVWFGVGAIGGLGVLVGGILTIISLVNRSRAKRSRAQIAAQR